MAAYPAHETRKLMKQVAKAIHERQDRVSCKELFAECQKLKPSSFCKSFFSQYVPALVSQRTVCLVSTGGRLFEHYLEAYGSYTSHKQWKRIKARAKEDGQEALVHEDVQAELIQRESGGFHGYVLQSCACIGNTGKRQLFFTTFVAKYHGLSRMGTEILAHYNFMMSRGLYEAMRQEQVSKAREQTR